MQEPFLKNCEEYFIIKSWSHNGVTAGFTTKRNGNSNQFNGSLNLAFHVDDDLETVRNNRIIIADKLGFPVETWVGAEQTHGNNIEQINHQHAGKGALEYESSVMQTDGFYTDEEDILLTMCYADCVPIFFYSPSKRRTGIVHAGWKGSVMGIAKELVEQWRQEGIAAKDIFAVIGPSICGKCYIVDQNVIAKVQKWVMDEENKPYNEISAGQFELDLRKLNQIILKKAGIPSKQIEATSLCTSCDKEDFFSHRRDKGHTGRMMGFIGMKGE